MASSVDQVLPRGRAGVRDRLASIAGHALIADGAIAVTAAALSIAGLSSQHRLGSSSLIFCAALCAPLLVHRLNVHATFVLIAAVAFVQWLTSVPQLADIAVLLALYWVALECGVIELALAAGAVEFGAIIAAVRWSPSQPLKVWVGLTGLATAAGVLGVTVRQRQALLISLRDEATRLEVERDQEGRLAAAAERARIAREMHDIVSHNLSVMIALADGAGYAIESSPERASQATAQISATGRQALDEMRRLLGVLREDVAEQPLSPQPGLDRLDELLAALEAAGVPVTIALEGDAQALSEGLQLTLFRVAQEALTNTLKHARRPTSAHLALRCDAGGVELEVTDTGDPDVGLPAGAPEEQGAGRGLRGMRERAAVYGGRLDAGPRPDGGWRVRLRMDADVEVLAR
jgi:signal transduction histidine kinase